MYLLAYLAGALEQEEFSNVPLICKDSPQEQMPDSFLPPVLTVQERDKIIDLCNIMRKV